MVSQRNNKIIISINIFSKSNRTQVPPNINNAFAKGMNVISANETSMVISMGSKTYMSMMFSTIGKQKPPDGFEKGVRRISYVLVEGTSVACTLTPQMLPLIVNTSLAKGALTIAKDKCVVKSITAIRDMESMDILCIEKIITLTMDRLVLTDHLDGCCKTREKVLRFAFLNSYC